MNLYNNISCKQLNFDGRNTDFYLSDNVYYRDKVIDSISFFVAPTGVTMSCPFDGGSLADMSFIEKLYITLVNDKKEIVVQNVSIKDFMLISNKRHILNQRISFSMSYLTYIGPASDLTGLSILMYVSWDGEYRNDEHASTISRSVTFTYSGTAQKLRISDYVDEWIRRAGYTIKKITVTGSQCYVSLHETSGRIFECVPSYRLNDLLDSARNPYIYYSDDLVLSDFDVDLKNSWLIPAETATPYELTVTLYY